MRPWTRPALMGLALLAAGSAVWFGGPVLLRQVGFFKVRRVELVGVTAATPAEIATARFYAEHILNTAPGLRDSIVDGAEAVTALALEAF